jgi:hypothetical protein
MSVSSSSLPCEYFVNSSCQIWNPDDDEPSLPEPVISNNDLEIISSMTLRPMQKWKILFEDTGLLYDQHNYYKMLADKRSLMSLLNKMKHDDEKVKLFHRKIMEIAYDASLYRGRVGYCKVLIKLFHEIHPIPPPSPPFMRHKHQGSTLTNFIATNKTL